MHDVHGQLVLRLLYIFRICDCASPLIMCAITNHVHCSICCHATLLWSTLQLLGVLVSVLCVVTSLRYQCRCKADQEWKHQKRAVTRDAYRAQLDCQENIDWNVRRPSCFFFWIRNIRLVHTWKGKIRLIVCLFLFLYKCAGMLV